MTRRSFAAGIGIAALLGLIAFSVDALFEHAHAASPSYQCVRIDYVLDGDTVAVRDCNTGRKIRVRLAGVWAPELDEPGGIAAKAQLQRLLSRDTHFTFFWNGEWSYRRQVGNLLSRQVNAVAQMNAYLASRSPTETEAVVTSRVSDPSCSSTATGWVTVGPCYRGSAGYDARFDGDNDGISCERGCRFWRR